MNETPNKETKLDSLGRTLKEAALENLEFKIAASDLRKKGMLIFMAWVETLNDEELKAVQQAVIRML